MQLLLYFQGFTFRKVYFGYYSKKAGTALVPRPGPSPFCNTHIYLYQCWMNVIKKPINNSLSLDWSVWPFSHCPSSAFFAREHCSVTSPIFDRVWWTACIISGKICDEEKAQHQTFEEPWMRKFKQLHLLFAVSVPICLYLEYFTDFWSHFFLSAVISNQIWIQKLILKKESKEKTGKFYAEIYRPSENWPDLQQTDMIDLTTYL